jgi:hypothetical protein
MPPFGVLASARRAVRLKVLGVGVDTLVAVERGKDIDESGKVVVKDVVVVGTPAEADEAFIDVKPTLALIVAEPDCRNRVTKPEIGVAG